MLASRVATRLWLLSAWNVSIETEKLSSSFYLNLIQFKNEYSIQLLGNM